MSNNTYKLHILGSRGTRSVFEDNFREFGGGTSCYILENGCHAVIIDCGSGLYAAKKLLKDCKTIDILLTHVHYDHVVGLLDETVFPEDIKCRFYGNFSKWSKDNIFNDLFKKPFWPVNKVKGEMTDVKYGENYDLNSQISFKAFPSNHPDYCNLYCIKIGDKKICILSDYEKGDLFDSSVVHDADYLIYDGMYDVDEYEKKKGWGHSSWFEGCTLAKKENVKQLIITHHSPFNDDNKLKEMENKCKDEYANSRFARKGDVYTI